MSLNNAVSVRNHVTSGGRVTDIWWIWKDLEGNIHGLIVLPSQHVPGGTEENHKNYRTASVPAEIWSRHFQNTILEYYSYTKLLFSLEHKFHTSNTQNFSLYLRENTVYITNTNRLIFHKYTSNVISAYHMNHNTLLQKMLSFYS